MTGVCGKGGRAQWGVLLLLLGGNGATKTNLYSVKGSLARLIVERIAGRINPKI